MESHLLQEFQSPTIKKASGQSLAFGIIVECFNRAGCESIHCFVIVAVRELIEETPNLFRFALRQLRTL